MIYYEFDRTGNGGKYKRMTEAEYELAKQDPNRFFMEGWDEEHEMLLYLMECSKAELDAYQREQKGIRNRLRDRSDHSAHVLSIEGDSLDCSEAWIYLNRMWILAMNYLRLILCRRMHRMFQ